MGFDVKTQDDSGSHPENSVEAKVAGMATKGAVSNASQDARRYRVGSPPVPNLLKIP